MVGNVFERQPKYQDDLQTCIQSILMVSVSWDSMTLSYRVTLSYIGLHWVDWVTLSWVILSYIELIELRWVELYWVTLSYTVTLYYTITLHYIVLHWTTQLHWVTLSYTVTCILSYTELHSYMKLYWTMLSMSWILRIQIKVVKVGAQYNMNKEYAQTKFAWTIAEWGLSLARTPSLLVTVVIVECVQKIFAIDAVQKWHILYFFD